MISNGEFYADKLMDLANLAAAALIFGQLAEGHLRWFLFCIGTGLFLLCLVVSYWLRKGGRRR